MRYPHPWRDEGIGDDETCSLKPLLTFTSEVYENTHTRKNTLSEFSTEGRNSLEEELRI
jgi:hypothetical protein